MVFLNFWSFLLKVSDKVCFIHLLKILEGMIILILRIRFLRKFGFGEEFYFCRMFYLILKLLKFFGNWSLVCCNLYLDLQIYYFLINLFIFILCFDQVLFFGSKMVFGQRFFGIS